MSGIIGTEGSKSGVIGLAPTNRFDEWYLNTVFTSSGDTVIGGVGSVMTRNENMGLSLSESSGIFTIPEIGVFRMDAQVNVSQEGASRYPYIKLFLGSTARAFGKYQVNSHGGTGYGTFANANASFSFRTTSTSQTVKAVQAGSAVTVTTEGAGPMVTWIRITHLGK